ncbi:quinoprotein glucose dehydrogenase [Paenibacillus nanensis]|uniref:Quinoprotein glucose dehydrogenase n=1 Tax=Paenibacillus nanensis TaxID=393251 RepID=A0A3A1VJH0_9BACL|nr:PQQ-dependent sugar dehydrogenase [Paenibacillus nanensis]RIX60464.1 quinoprotein glucose dehydrogenase [Paenibacillus nanensis]
MARRLRLSLAAVMLAALVSSCSGNDNDNAPKSSGDAAPTASGPPNPTKAAETPAPTEHDEPVEADEPYRVVAAGLRIPWAIEFADDVIYVSEREGNIVKIENGEMKRQAVRLTKAVRHEGEGGFLGLLLAPDFAETGLAYAYHTYQDNGKTFNRIVLLKLEGSEWAEQRALLEKIPGDMYHNGGRLAFGPDGMLYATTGDAEERALSQDKNSLAGKILRMTPEGEIPSDNPFGQSYVYSYGHRNPQGIAWTKAGVMYSTEHGPSGQPGGHDEINKIEPGRNYGWPSIIGDAAQAGMETPLYHTGDEAIAPSGTIVDDQGRLIIAALRGEAIYRYTLETGKMEVLHEGEGRIRDLELRGGKLYLITNNRDGRGQPSATDDRLIAMDYT